LSEAMLKGASLRSAGLASADLRSANLQGADLYGASLRMANLENAYLGSANLDNTILYHASLASCDLRAASLHNAVLKWATLHDADLSGATGLLSQSRWLRSNFKFQDGLILAYKIQANITDTDWPTEWRWVKGSILTEVVNPCRTDDCGCGVNVATLEWCLYVKGQLRAYRGAPIWKVLVDPAGAVVPYATDGKFRAEWVRLVEPWEEK
jgi:hypothetical protein